MRKPFDPSEPPDDTSETHFEDGLFGSLQRVLVTLLGMVESRFELFAVELQEARLRALFILGWSVALIFFSFFVVLALVGMLVFLLWEQGLMVLIASSIFFSLAAVACFMVARAKLKELPFEESINQLRKDREMASGKNEE